MKTIAVVFVCIVCSLWIGYSIILLFKLFILILSEVLKSIIPRDKKE